MEAGFSWPDFLLKSRPQSLMLTPFQLDVLLRSLPAGFPRQSMDVIVISGAVPPHLYERATTQLSSEIYVTYGSTEAGYVATSAPGGAGAANVAENVCPHAEVEIVDADEARQPAGRQGRLRIRSPELVNGYAEAADTHGHFKDGWFYPGDLGSLGADGALTLDGRETEVFDIGGLRIAPSAIEEVLLACEGVRDAAAFAVRVDGMDWPHAAVVCEPGCDLRAAELRLAHERPQLKARLVAVEEIPRSDRGKARRDLLARRFGVSADMPRSSRQSGSEATGSEAPGSEPTGSEAPA